MTEANKNAEIFPENGEKVAKLPKGILPRVLSFFFEDIPSDVEDEAGFICNGIALTVSPMPKSVDPMTVVMGFFSLVKTDDGEVGGSATMIYETTIPIAPGVSLKGIEHDRKRGLIPEEEKAAALALLEELKVSYDQAIANGETFNDAEGADTESAEAVSTETAAE